MVVLPRKTLIMAAVLEIHDYWVQTLPSGTYCHFEATVEDAVMVSPATRFSPEEWGEARCVGDVLLADDELPPGADNEAEQLLLADTVQNWELPEPEMPDITPWHDYC